MKNNKRLLLLSVFLSFFLVGGTIQAQCGQSCTPGTICFLNPLTACSVEELIERLINFIFIAGIAIAPLMILIAAYNFITAGGDPKKVQTARNIILYTLIGLVIVILSKALVILVKNLLGVS